MNRRSSSFSLGIAALLGGVALVASLAVRPSESSAADPSGSASPTASAAESAAPSASAASSAAADAGPPLPRFDAEPFSDEKSPKPTPADWKPTTPVALTEPLPFNCKAYRVREWVKIRCSKLPSSLIAMLSGDREGVMLFIDPPLPDMSTPGGGEIVFPVRRGDRRVFEWSTFGESYEGPGFPEVAFMISQSWAPDEPGPTIIAQ